MPPPSALDQAATRFRILPEPPPDGEGGLVLDRATGLVWTRSANPLGYPLPWAEALETVAAWNREGLLGHADWRMPNRRELRSLIDHSRRQPALPPGHPFRDVFSGWVWTSTSKAGQEAYAWNAHLEGGRMFYSRKDEFRLLWPVRGPAPGQARRLARTGQTACFDALGREIPCAGTGQDGALQLGVPWPEPRFRRTEQGILDRLTGLVWLAPEHLAGGALTWDRALELASSRGAGWRLPDIDELEGLVDAGRADPAWPEELALLLGNAPPARAEGLWSATSSGFDPAWAFVLYVQKGAVGVGFKQGAEFLAWPVRGPENPAVYGS